MHSDSRPRHSGACEQLLVLLAITDLPVQSAVMVTDVQECLATPADTTKIVHMRNRRCINPTKDEPGSRPFLPASHPAIGARFGIGRHPNVHPSNVCAAAKLGVVFRVHNHVATYRWIAPSFLGGECATLPSHGSYKNVHLLGPLIICASINHRLHGITARRRPAPADHSDRHWCSRAAFGRFLPVATGSLGWKAAGQRWKVGPMMDWTY